MSPAMVPAMTMVMVAADTGADAHRRVHKHGGFKQSGIYGGVADGCIHDFVCRHATYHSDVAEERGDDDALGNDELQYRPRLGADGFSYAKLSGSLLHGDEHDVAYAHDSAQQGEQTYYPSAVCMMAIPWFIRMLSMYRFEPDGSFVIRGQPGGCC